MFHFNLCHFWRLLCAIAECFNINFRAIINFFSSSDQRAGSVGLGCREMQFPIRRAIITLDTDRECLLNASMVFSFLIGWQKVQAGAAIIELI